jgi:hypothetical protein
MTSPKGDQAQSLEPHIGREGVWPTHAIPRWRRAKKMQEGGLLNALAPTPSPLPAGRAVPFPSRPNPPLRRCVEIGQAIALEAPARHRS